MATASESKENNARGYEMKGATTAKRRRSRIIETVLETARDLHRLGYIDASRMRRYEQLEKRSRKQK